MYSPNRVPDEWAKAQNNLGNALLALGERKPGSEGLEQAAAAYRAALSMSSRELKPLEWAATQSNLGSALLALGARESGNERLHEAVEALRAALEVSTRESAPLQWGAIKLNFGNALSALGERELGGEHLEQAETVVREALEELARERVSLDWAQTQSALGTALLVLQSRKTSPRTRRARPSPGKTGSHRRRTRSHSLAGKTTHGRETGPEARARDPRDISTRAETRSATASLRNSCPQGTNLHSPLSPRTRARPG